MTIFLAVIVGSIVTALFLPLVDVAPNVGSPNVDIEPVVAKVPFVGRFGRSTRARLRR